MRIRMAFLVLVASATYVGDTRSAELKINLGEKLGKFLSKKKSEKSTAEVDAASSIPEQEQPASAPSATPSASQASANIYAQGGIENLKKGANATLTFDEVAKCAGVLDMQNIFKMRNPHSPYTQEFSNVYITSSVKYKIWDKMIALNPEWKSLPASQAESKRYSYTSKLQNQQLKEYTDDLPKLKADFDQCRRLGLF